MNKCEWCENGRYTSIIPTRDMNPRYDALYIMDLVKTENGYFMEIDRQKPPKVYWNTLLKKKINYCPFCGKKLENILKGEDNESN